MSAAWMPVALAAIIVIGVVGGTLMQMILKELLPLLRKIAEDRHTGHVGNGGSPALEALERRLTRLETDQRELKEENAFLRELLESRSERSLAGERE